MLRRDPLPYKLTQREVAAGMGVSQPSYAAWERHSVALSADQMQKLAGLFGVEVADLFRDEAGGLKRNGPVGRARKTLKPSPTCRAAVRSRSST
jgi:transcriptional regulator with XRE-family HTH domain